MAELITPLHSLHQELGARLVPFAGYSMPVQYPTGIIAEHNQTRTAAGLFDVCHMGQVTLTPQPGVDMAEALERLVPSDILGLAPGRTRYTVLTTEAGGIIDDLMVTRPTDPDDNRLFLVVNAARKTVDLDHLRRGLGEHASVDYHEDRALMALQGPAAVTAMGRLAPELAELPFMGAAGATIDGVACWVGRSGYTGEDGFEISCPSGAAEQIARLLLADGAVRPCGLGARDSLRLEAGLCLYGNDIDETTSPVEAGLVWIMGKRRKSEGGFIGDKVILDQLAHGPSRRRVGLRPDGRQPARGGTAILSTEGEGAAIGTVTSGGFGPTVGAPIAMGYVESASAAQGTPVQLEVRGRRLPAVVSSPRHLPKR